MIDPGDSMAIGRFSRWSRLPVSTLRYYHQEGLLVPAHVDPASGYRYYRREQLEAAWMVAELREIGVSPRVIAEVLDGGADLAASLRRERDRLVGELAARARAIARVDALLGGDGAGWGPVAIGERTRRRLAAERGLVAGERQAADVRRLVVQLRRRLRAGGVSVHQGRFGAVFPLDPGDGPTPTTVFAALPEPGIPLPGETLELEAAPVATIEHTGDLVLGPAYDALFGWMRERGHEPVGPVVEEYGADAGVVRTRISVGLA